jgi:hypothetical protein
MTEERKVIVVEIILILEINTNGYLSTSHYPVSLEKQASTCHDTERRKRLLIPWNRFLGFLKV